jgi:O-antigen/teichoic acid export membrane protein
MSAVPGARTPSPKRTLITGALWSVGTRWSIKGIGFINTVIMARLLMPADYGVVAMAMLVVGLIQAMMDSGAATALLRKEAVSTDEIDSAWTLRLIQSLAVGALLMSVAPLAAGYFDEPRVLTVLWVLAACVAISGLGNIGLTLAQKAFRFSLEFRINVIAKVLSVVATLVAGYLLRDYRALVIGIATGYVSLVVLSYALHPYRPRWNTRKIAEIWALTKWLMLAGMGTTLLHKSDELVAARIGSTAEYGLYNVGSDLGRLPVGQLGPAMMRAFLPVLSTLQGDLARTRSAVLKTLAAVNAITLPMGLGVAALAAPLTALVLGDKWAGAAPFVALFAVVGSAQFIASPLSTLLVLGGHTRTQTTAVWVEFSIFLITALVLVPVLHLAGLVVARLLASVANTLAMAAFARTRAGLPMSGVALALWRPLLGAVAMHLAVVWAVAQVAGPATQLLVGVCTGVLLYSIWLLASWLLAGRPEGLESTVLDALGIKAYRGRLS